jgi:hypothetical protein
VPLISIQTNVTDDAIRKCVAAAATDVFGSVGIRREHVTTVFRTVAAHDIFVGGTPLDEEVDRHIGFALIEVAMSATRGEPVRDALATALADAMGEEVDRGRLSIDFVAREAHDVFIGTQPLARSRSNQPSSPPSIVGGDLEGSLRRSLAAYWNDDQLLTCEHSDLLEDLRPMGTWDSLAIVELAVYLEIELDLSASLEMGEELVRAAFGEGATLADLLALVGRCSS